MQRQELETKLRTLNNDIEYVEHRCNEANMVATSCRETKQRLVEEREAVKEKLSQCHQQPHSR